MYMAAMTSDYCTSASIVTDVQLDPVLRVGPLNWKISGSDPGHGMTAGALTPFLLQLPDQRVAPLLLSFKVWVILKPSHPLGAGSGIREAQPVNTSCGSWSVYFLMDFLFIMAWITGFLIISASGLP